MSKVSPIYHLARAGFLERIRSYSFLIVLGATVLLAYLLVPVDEARYTVMRFSGYRGIYNSKVLGFWGQTGAFAFNNPEKDLFFTGTINQASGFGHSAAYKAIIKIIKSA